MGTEIVRVPRGFAHPADDTGYPIPGAHYELLYGVGPESCVCYKLYENVTEGICLAFETLTELSDWVRGQGSSDELVSCLLKWGTRPPLLLVCSSGTCKPPNLRLATSPTHQTQPLTPVDPSKS